LYKCQRVYAIGGISTDITEEKKWRIRYKLLTSSSICLRHHGITVDKIKKLIIHFKVGIFRWRTTKSPFLNYVHPEDQVITQKEIDKLTTGILYNLKTDGFADKSVKWLYGPLRLILKQDCYMQSHMMLPVKDIEQSLLVADTFF
jgi:hypothetical protein